MEPQGSLPHIQEPTKCPYPEPDQSSPCFPIPTSGRFVEKNEMGGACSMYGRQEMCIQGIDGEIWGKGNTWKT